MTRNQILQGAKRLRVPYHIPVSYSLEPRRRSAVSTLFHIKTLIPMPPNVKPEFENLFAEPEKIIGLLIADVQELQTYFLRLYAKNQSHEHAQKFNQCNNVIEQLSRLR